MKRILLIVIMILFIFLVTGCVPGDGTYTEQKPAGFFWGVWHGWMAPISLIIALFDKKIRVYEVMNTGWWYDFGFYMSIVGGFGGLALSRRRKNDNGGNIGN